MCVQSVNSWNSWNSWSDDWLSHYRYGADSSATAGAEESLLLGNHVKQDEHISCDEDHCVFIQWLQVPPASAVVTKGVAESRTQRRAHFRSHKDTTQLK